MEIAKIWLEHYGYIILFLALFLELIALPTPGELLMSYAGLLAFEGHLNVYISILVAGFGSSIGITLSYFVGRKLGPPFFHKYGSKIHLGPEKLEKTSTWFKKYGNIMLIIGYFIPGVRHITGYFSGITKIAYRSFAVYAYLGAFLWATTFVGLGKVLGPKWNEYHPFMSKYLIYGALLAAVLFGFYYVYKVYKQQILEWAVTQLSKLMVTFHSFGRVKFLVAGTAAAFLGLFILMLGVIQDFLAFVLLGGELLEEGLRRLFHRAEPFPGTLYSFPSEQSLMVLTVYGFVTFLLIRHSHSALLRIMAPLMVIVISLLVGISRVYLGVQYSSDVWGGYIFGGVWLSLNIILLEIYRLKLTKPAFYR